MRKFNTQSIFAAKISRSTVVITPQDASYSYYITRKDHLVMM